MSRARGCYVESRHFQLIFFHNTILKLKILCVGCSAGDWRQRRRKKNQFTMWKIRNNENKGQTFDAPLTEHLIATQSVCSYHSTKNLTFLNFYFSVGFFGRQLAAASIIIICLENDFSSKSYRFIFEVWAMCVRKLPRNAWLFFISFSSQPKKRKTVGNVECEL